MRPKLLLYALVILGALYVFAQEEAPAAAVEVAEHAEYGSILTDADGLSLYLFVNEEEEDAGDRMTEGVRANAAPCTEGCLDTWPPVTGEVAAGEGVDEELLYTADVDGMSMAVYNGWPLYYFAGDAAAGDTNGQGLGQAPTFWYLVSPEGAPVTGSE